MCQSRWSVARKLFLLLFGAKALFLGGIGCFGAGRAEAEKVRVKLGELWNIFLGIGGVEDLWGGFNMNVGDNYGLKVGNSVLVGFCVYLWSENSFCVVTI